MTKLEKLLEQQCDTAVNTLRDEALNLAARIAEMDTTAKYQNVHTGQDCKFGDGKDITEPMAAMALLHKAAERVILHYRDDPSTIAALLITWVRMEAEFQREVKVAAIDCLRKRGLG